ncbi:MAG: hypothetical protein VYB46_13475 [Pseudomonadota bacterium]|nr:hypothetical protein [Pseudomonadota bacterium]
MAERPAPEVRYAASACGWTVFSGCIMGRFDHAAGRAGCGVPGACRVHVAQKMVFHALLTADTDFTVKAREVRRGRTSFMPEPTGIADPGARIIMVAVEAAGQSRPLAA